MKLPFSIGKKYKKISQQGCIYTYSVSISGQDFTEMYQQALVRVQAIVSLPGFRVGKVPINMVREKFPSMIKDEIVDISARTYLDEIVKTEDIIPVILPVIKSINYEDGKSLSFEIVLECSPKFDVKGYENIKVEKKIRAVTDEDVANYMKRFQEYNAFLKPVAEGTTVDKNHFVVVNYECFENGNKLDGGSANAELVDMSSPQTIAGLPDAIIGSKKGEVREFNSVFEDRKVLCKVTVVEIKEKVVPEIDENFLKEAGVTSHEELKNKIKSMLEQQESAKSEKELINQIEDAIIKNNPMSLPPTLVQKETNELFEILKQKMKDTENLKEETMLQHIRPIAERNLKISYILHNIAKKEKIEATEADFNSELDRVLKEMKTQEEKEKARELFNKRREYILAMILENKTMNFIKSKSIIIERG